MRLGRHLGRTGGGLVAALDVGCSKVCCFIARAEETGAPPRVIGIGQQASRGVRRGAVVDMPGLEMAIRQAVHAAEHMAGQTVERVIASLTGGSPASNSIAVEIDINGHEVGEADLRRAFEHGHHAGGVNGHSDGRRELIHSIPVAYRIDGSRGIRDPRGLCGEHLGVRLHFVTASTSAVRNLTTVIQRCHLDVEGYVVSPYAAGLAVLSEDEMELGATVIDMGGGTTGIAVFAEGSVQFTDVVPVGGIHVTNDIARGLATPIAQAERIKTLYGHAMATGADRHETIAVPRLGEDDTGEAQQVARSLLIGIVQPRLEETFELVRARLEASGFDRIAGRQVVLTGGASQLPGTPDLAQLILDRRVRVGRPSRVEGLAEATSGPGFATGAGLLLHAQSMARSAAGGGALYAAVPESLTERVTHWFRENF